MTFKLPRFLMFVGVVLTICSSIVFTGTIYLSIRYIEIMDEVIKFAEHYDLENGAEFFVFKVGHLKHVLIENQENGDVLWVYDSISNKFIFKKEPLIEKYIKFAPVRHEYERTVQLIDGKL